MRALLAGDRRVKGGRSQNCAPYMGSGRGWLAVDGGGVLNITAAAWTAGFQWLRSGNITRTQNVSEYMLVLALCVVYVMTAYSKHVELCIEANATKSAQQRSKQSV